MNKRDYLLLIDELRTLPVPGTILYPPADKTKGHELLWYEITKEGLVAVVNSNTQPDFGISWTLEQVKMCTYKIF